MSVAAPPTEFPFVLPRGYLDGEGTLHREGVMRLATAHDEVAPLRDPRVQANPAYLVVILLSRVITRLGELEAITPNLVEGLFAGDFGYLEDLYQRVNGNGHAHLDVACPHCEQRFEVEMPSLGG